MKNYTITVNGTVYQVTVEEGITGGVTQNAAPAPAAAAPAPAPAPAPAAAPAAAPANAGGINVTASVPGKIVSVAAPVGTAVKAGDTVIMLEAMKMEIPVVAPQDGTVASVNVTPGQMVESGDILATMN